MGIRNSFRIGFKRGILRRSLKREINYKWYHFGKKLERLTLKDINYFPEELIDFLIEVKPKDIFTLKEYIDAWLHLESEAMNTKRLYYDFGKAKNIFKNTKKTKKNINYGKKSNND